MRSGGRDDALSTRSGSIGGGVEGGGANVVGEFVDVIGDEADGETEVVGVARSDDERLARSGTDAA